jgi:hypothetical protein
MWLDHLYTKAKGTDKLSIRHTNKCNTGGDYGIIMFFLECFGYSATSKENNRFP